MVVILVVSSEERISRHVRSVLGSEGWLVTSASDREEALRASADREPALVIVDCEVDDAAELVRTFGAKNGGPGVLLLEPASDGDGAFHDLEAGADQVLSKPPRARQLLEAAERVMSLPHQSAGARATDMGEKLSANEIFGDVLMELDATEPGTSAGHEASAAEPEPAEVVSTDAEESTEIELLPDEGSVELFGEPSAEGTEPGTTADPDEKGPSLETLEELEVTEAGGEESDTSAGGAEPEVVEGEMPATDPRLEIAPEGESGSLEDTEAVDLAEESSVDTAAAGLPSETGVEVGTEEDEELLAGTEAGEVEFSDGAETSTAKTAGTGPGENREVSSLTFDPSVLGAEVNEVEMVVSGLVPAPAEPDASAEPRIAEGPGAGFEPEDLPSAAAADEGTGAGFEPEDLPSAAAVDEGTGAGFEPEDLPSAAAADEGTGAGFEPEDLPSAAAVDEGPGAGFEPEDLPSAAAVDEGTGAGFEPEDLPSEPVPPPSVPESPREGEEGRFGQYRLDERIAVGGMAEVWRASMLGMEGFRKTVAIKKILPHLAENSEFVAMFIEEAKLAAQLSHENLVEIYDLGKIGESFFIAMEYVEGKDLRGLLNRLRKSSDQMPIGLAMLIAAEVARGLEYAHTREDSAGSALGLVHRDVSPRNVLIGHDGRVRLCDFGVAKAVSSVIQTQIGALKGKLQYMSPEQASGRPVDNRSDIYSLGSVMYEMISGRRLYEEDNEISLLDAVRAGNFDDPREHCPGLPREVRRILIKALAKKPVARYQSAGALEQDLRAILRTLEPAPAEQTLSAFVRELFAETAQAQARSVGESETFPSVVTATSDGSEAVTRSLQTNRPAMGGKVARFWWGMAAGLLAAGLAATMLKLLLG